MAANYVWCDMDCCIENVQTRNNSEELLAVVIPGREGKERGGSGIFSLNTLPGNQTHPCAPGLDLTWKAKMGKAPGKQRLPHHTGEGNLSPGIQRYITLIISTFLNFNIHEC